MTAAVHTDFVVPEVLTEALQGAYTQKNAFISSQMVSNGYVRVSDTMPARSPQEIGNTIKIPYFGTIGDFESVADGSSATPVALKQTYEEGTVARDALAFELTNWAQMAAAGDPYAEAARQLVLATARNIDSLSMTAAVATGALSRDVYSATVPVKLDMDVIIDALSLWGDMAAGMTPGLFVHSRVYGDLLKLKSSDGVPLLRDAGNGEVPRINGLPVIRSDRLPLTGSAMGTVTSAGTSPPVLTITGTPTGPWDLLIDCQVGGAHTTATYKFSTDGGQNWSAAITTLAAAAPQALTDTATDSLVGNNGSTGLTVEFAAGTFNADNTWVSKAGLKCTSLIVLPGALAFWYNRAALRVQTDRDILKDSDVAAVHLYRVAHRYRRMPGGTKPGIIKILHNTTDPT